MTTMHCWRAALSTRRRTCAAPRWLATQRKMSWMSDGVEEQRLESGTMLRDCQFAHDRDDVLAGLKPATAKLVFDRRTKRELQHATRIFDADGVVYKDSFANEHHALATEESLPELAFMGRSNCGKSSLLNAVLGKVVAQVRTRRQRARQQCSLSALRAPPAAAARRHCRRSRTRQAARAAPIGSSSTRSSSSSTCPATALPKRISNRSECKRRATHRKRACVRGQSQPTSWHRLEATFFHKRRSLSAVLLLLDSRRGITKLDQERIDAMETAGVNYQARRRAEGDGGRRLTRRRRSLC
jgi:hypothetical protein